MGEVDAAIVTTQMMLETENIGLGTTWVGYFDKEELIKEFKIPENFVPVSILPIGYPKAGVEPNPLHFERKDLSETVFYNKSAVNRNKLYNDIGNIRYKENDNNLNLFIFDGCNELVELYEIVVK